MAASHTQRLEDAAMATRALVTLVVDRSGSMDQILIEAQTGIKKFIADQAALPGVKVSLLLYQFDDVFEHVFGPVMAKDAPPYKLKPRSMTALYDAIGKSIVGTKAVADAATAKGKPFDKVVIVPMTDGKENASQEHTFKSVTALVEAQKAEGWEFVFLAGHLEAVKFGQQAGLATTSYNPRQPGGMQTAYATASGITRSHLTRQAPAEPDQDQAGLSHASK